MQKLYFFVFLFFLFLSGNKITAQTFQYDWTDAHGGNTTSYSYQYNYYYSCGYSYYYTCTGTTSGVGTQAASFSETKLSANQNNEIIFTGTGNRTFDVDSGPTTLNISPSSYTVPYTSAYYYNYGYTLNSNESFVGKRKNDGSIAWAGYLKATLNNVSSSNNIIGQVVTAAGDVIIAGIYFVPTNLNFVSSSTPFIVNPVSQGVQDIFIAKYNGTTGELIWGKTLGTNGSDLINDIALDSGGNIIISGNTNGSNLDLDTGTDTQIVDGQTTGQRSFIAKYDSDFNFLWKLERRFTTLSKIKVDGSNNVYEFSSYNGAGIDLNGTTGITNFTSNGTHSFISKYSSSGNYIWTKELKKDDNTIVSTSIADTKIINNSIYFILNLNSANSTDLNPDPTQQNLIQNDVGTRTIVQWSTDGEYIWNLPVYNTFSNSIYNLDVNANGEILFADYNYSGYDVDPSSGVLNLAPGNTYWIKLNADHTVNFASPLRFPSNKIISDIIYDNAGNVIVGGNSGTTTANLNTADLSENSFLSQNVGEQNYFITQYKLNCTTIAPTADATQSFCNEATVADLSAIGTAIKWYDAASSGTQLLATASLVNGTKYYASQTLNGCESILRTEVTAVINTTAAPTASATQPFCNAATVANLSATGTAIKWYDAASSGTQLLATAALVNDTKYYASQTLNGCESILRTEVTAVINTTAAPIASATQPFCNAATVASLSATGTAIKWYDAASSGTQLLATASLVNGTKYYASQTLNGCESVLRTEVTAVINTTAAPSASATQPFCNAATVASLSATGTAIKWYDAATSGTQLLPTAALVNGTKYYASQTLNGCESILRTEVTAVINTTAAPTASATQPFCNAATVANLSATGTAIKWYDAASSGTQLLATATLVNGTKYYASQTLNGCESILRTEVTAVINTTAAPTASATQPFCNAATVANLSATGTAIKWYDAASSGTQLLATATLVNGTKYYASQTLNGCESILRTEVTAVINTTAAPTASATQPFCNAATVASLSATGTAIKWYDAASSGTQLLATATLVNGTKYYASQTLNGCESILRTEVTAVINTTAAPTASSTQSFCNAATIANLSATGTAIKWYDAAASGAQLLPTAALVNGTKYYASQTLNGCESILRTEVTAVINTTAAPTASATQPFCNAATVANLSATGTAIKWYDAASSGTQLLATAALVNGTKYYASQTLNGCESILRTEVTAVINTTAAPSAASTQSFCNAATIANLSATGTAIKWYDAATSGAQLLPTAALVNGTKYYASQTLNGCESILRTEVTAVINTTAAPSASATQPFCNAATVASLSATGTAIKWYDAASSGTQLLATAALVNGTKYYASQTLNGCESVLRTEVTAVINTTVAPSAASTQSFCNAATIANLSATGTAIKWYDAATSGAQLLPTAALVNGTKYYASQTLNGCESILRTEVTAVINTTAAPTASATQPFCNAATVANLSATGTAIKWYDAASSGTQLLATAALVNGTKYYASQTLNGCESILRTEVTAVINTTAAPSAASTQSFCNAATIANLSATGTAIKWYDAATSGAQLLPTAALVNGTKYYASQTLNGCESALRTEVTAVINATAAPSASATQPFCSAATIADLSATGTAIKWYDAASSGTQLLPTAALVNGTKYYASQTLNGCESALRTEVTAVINTTATPVATATQSFCSAATIADLSATGTAIKWYDAASSGTQLLPTTALVNGTKYYASQTLNGCESALRTEVTAVINATTAPSATATQPFCNGATVANLSVTGTAIKWYDAAASGTALLPTTTLVNGTKYYASQTLNGCESILRTEVTVSINVVTAPTGNANQEFCNSGKIADLTAVGSNIQWFAGATGGIALSSNMTLVNGVKYYASQTINGCQSASRLAVTAVIKTVPNPTGPGIQQFCSESNPALADVYVNSDQVIWYDSFVNGNILSLDYRLTDGETVYAGNYDSNTKCESSSRLAVTVKIIDSKLEYYNLITVNGNNLNNKLTIKGIDKFPVNNIEIFNRYGNLVWKADNYNNENNFFEGKSNSRDVFMKNNFLPTGTYYFVLKYRTNCKSNQLKGFLQIDNNQ